MRMDGRKRIKTFAAAHNVRLGSGRSWVTSYSPRYTVVRQMPLNSPPSIRNEAPVIHFAAGDTK
jgi:hypothetical protein